MCVLQHVLWDGLGRYIQADSMLCCAMLRRQHVLLCCAMCRPGFSQMLLDLLEAEDKLHRYWPNVFQAGGFDCMLVVG